MNNTLLEVKNLSISFQTDQGLEHAVNNAHFSIKQGETLALVGESGGGKTMIGLAIMQLLPAAARVSYASKILLQEKDLLQLSELEMHRIRGKRIGMIFQEAMTALNPVLTIRDQIDEVLRCHFHWSQNERHHKILILLDEVGVPEPEQFADSYPHQLSGGMRQRAMIAMALAGEPDLLIADEPTTALDVTIQAQILTLLKTLQEKRGMSLLFVTHDLGVVAKIADRVAVIYKGDIVEEANMVDFFRHPHSVYSQHLIEALPSWKKREYPFVPIKLEPPLLQIMNLKIYFPIQKGIFKRTVGYIKAVDDVTFSLYQGRTLALVGESGSGKTTTGKGIIRLLKLSGGEVDFEGVDIAKLQGKALHQMRNDLQIVFQDPYAAMNPRMLIKDIIEEGMLAHGIGGTEQQRLLRIDELLTLVGLSPESKYRYPHEFSGGQRQRICIARSLALEPKVIVCDEPTSSLDVSVQMQILKLLQKLQKEMGLSYLLITHNFAVVAYLADEVAVMHHGKIVEQGSVIDILQNPQHSYTKKLLASVPTIPGFEIAKENVT